MALLEVTDLVKEYDGHRVLREGTSVQQLKDLIAEAVASKPERHRLDEGDMCHRNMHQMGG